MRATSLEHFRNVAKQSKPPPLSPAVGPHEVMSAFKKARGEPGIVFTSWDTPGFYFGKGRHSVMHHGPSEGRTRAPRWTQSQIDTS